MADESQADDDPRQPPTLAGRLKALRLLLLAAAAVHLGGVALYEVPPLAALFSFAALAILAVLNGRDGRGRAPAAPAPSGRVIWPDTPMKVMLEAIDEPCFLSDPAGIIRYQNGSATDRFGAARPGDPLSFKLRVPELLAAVETVGRGAERQQVRFSERVPTERTYQASVAAIRLPRRDKRVRERPDFVLIRLHDETELMRMERMRGDFIANASHELRTPLASLTGFIETLLGPARNDEVNRDRFLNIMLDQAGRMSRLIDDLLSLSRIELKAHLRPEAPVDLGQVVGQAVDLLQPLARSAGATVTLTIAQGDLVVRGDRDELMQVALNLIENAIKYGREKGTVAVDLGPPADSPGQIALSVKDDGPGIAAEHLPRLTERFYRVDEDRSRRQKGTGLGLAIVKHIVARHRGRLVIRSKPSEGSTFTVTFDRANSMRPGTEVPFSSKNQ